MARTNLLVGDRVKIIPSTDEPYLEASEYLGHEGSVIWIVGGRNSVLGVRLDNKCERTFRWDEVKAI